jgi:hypothetical protein
MIIRKLKCWLKGHRWRYSKRTSMRKRTQWNRCARCHKTRKA